MGRGSCRAGGSHLAEERLLHTGAGQPETCTYTALYVLNDEEVGLVSDAVAVVCNP